VANITPLEMDPAPVYLFIAGSIAVCAWILPGLSGSFILLILGLYQTVIEAVKNLDVMVLLALGAGCVVGIVSFSQLLTRLFKHYRNETLGLLTGFMMGSLVKLWPWQHITSYYMKPDGTRISLVQEPISPFSFLDLTGNDPEILISVCGLVLGCLGVIGLNFLGEIGHDNRFDRNQA